MNLNKIDLLRPVCQLLLLKGTGETEMITFEPQYRYDFSCSVAQHYTSTDRQIIEGSFEAYYQLTDNEIKFEIAEHYVPKGYCSVSDFEWKEIKL